MDLPTVTEEQGAPEIVLERNEPCIARGPNQLRQSLEKLDDIDPKNWAERGVKPIRNVPKEFLAQHREILTDISLRSR